MSVSYELAQQLKDAGFPQTFPAQDKFYTADGKVVDTRRAKNNEWALTEFTSGYAIPTLSELIEECGAAFLSLNNYGELGWHVVGKDAEREEIEVTCPTPEEAVAKIWLALNKK